MKSILLPLTASMQEHAPISYAASLTNRFSAVLTGLFILPDPVGALSFIGEGLTADMMQDLLNATESLNQSNAEEAKRNFQQVLTEHGIAFETPESGEFIGNPDHAKARWLAVSGDISHHVGRKARVADIAICPTPQPDVPAIREVLNDLLYRSGRPVLIVPEHTEGTAHAEIITIAWNGSAECARAMAASLALLKSANTVTLLQIGNILRDRPGLEEAAEYLQNNQIQPATEKSAATCSSVAEDILVAATELNTDFLVTGAYSHNRWREMILGGVTSHLLENSKVPIFMSH